ncbi:AraC family transcriptional regulator [Paenibacillus oryzae]|uniref:AraC family transcriptional regulator n=1 Tax=Paenibacillus oryzae TaxID=1844972 RepID=A0A1A5YMU8_9BACL|nr:helix-turn-helix domain-containing protein [Paenibacillus oryzae]OBR66873.1 AraC family transcriptional regulator [Paenibacillus oryzae]
MTVGHRTTILTRDSFFEPDVLIYVNRAYETFEMNAHSHEFIEISYISEGAGMHYINDEAIPVERGTIFFIPIGYSHVFRPKTTAKGSPLIVYNCLFPVEYLIQLQAGFPAASEALSSFTAADLPWFSMKDVDGAYHFLFRELYREFYAKPPGYMAVLSALVLQILMGFYRNLQQVNTPAGDKPQWMAIDDAIANMHYHFASELKLGALAAAANLSERQFSRLFRKQTGMSFIQYLQNIRMEAACRLLTEGRSSIGEIASAVGYADMKFFYQLFRKKIGMTPCEYRNTARPSPDL